MNRLKNLLKNTKKFHPKRVEAIKKAACEVMKKMNMKINENDFNGKGFRKGEIDFVIDALEELIINKDAYSKEHKETIFIIFILSRLMTKEEIKKCLKGGAYEKKQDN